MKTGGGVYISARADYAVRAMLVIAASSGHGELVKAAVLAEAQDIPQTFLQGILVDLRHAGLLYSHRGMEGGYGLARPAGEITVGEVLRAVSGPLTTVRGMPPDQSLYRDAAAGLAELWQAVAAATETVVDRASLADVLVRQADANGQRRPPKPAVVVRNSYE